MDGWDPFADDAPTLAGLAAASVRGVAALGPRADLHAAVAVPAGARDRLERMCRYALRPAVGQERLRLSAAGQVVLDLRRRWADGTTHLVFDPVEFLERLAALVPRPRINLVLYYGVLAPRACGHGRVGRRPNRPWAELMERSFPPSPRLRRASLERFARKWAGCAGVPTLCRADDAGRADS